MGLENGGELPSLNCHFLGLFRGAFGLSCVSRWVEKSENSGDVLEVFETGQDLREMNFVVPLEASESAWAGQRQDPAD